MYDSYSEFGQAFYSLEDNCRAACIAAIEQRYTRNSRGLAGKLNVPKLFDKLGAKNAAEIAHKVADLDRSRRGLSLEQVTGLPTFISTYWELRRRGYLIEGA